LNNSGNNCCMEVLFCSRKGAIKDMSLKESLEESTKKSILELKFP
jgi:hypothetical protein